MRAFDDRIKWFLRPIVRSVTDRRRVREVGDIVFKLVPDLYLSKDSLVLDLGANRGDFTVWAAEFGATVIAFEPHPKAYKYLLKRTSRMKHVIALPLAVSMKTGIVDFFNHPDSEKDPLGYSIRSSLIKKNSQFIPSNTKVVMIDLLVFLESFERITCIKIDIEGSESDIWEALKVYSPKIDNCLIEIHDELNPGFRDEVNSFISQNDLQERWTADWI